MRGSRLKRGAIGAGPPARLVHLLHSLEVGGLERIAIALAREGRARGLDHQLLVFDRPPSGPPDELDAAGVPCDYLPRRPGFDLRFARELGAWFRAHGTELVHAHNDTSITYAALAGWMSRGGPTRVGTFHTRPSHGGRVARWISRRSTSASTPATCVSSELADRLVAERWTTTSPLVLENGVDLETFAPGPRNGAWREAFGTAEGARVLLCTARLASVKRHVDLMRAFAIASETLAQRLPAGCELWLAGEGPERARIEELAKSLPGVRLLGNVVAVAELLREVDAFALVSEHEAQPLALMEAMATGLPCVATQVGGIPALAGEAGLALRLVEPLDPHSIAAGLTDVLDPRSAVSLGRHARERMRACSAEHLFSRYAEVWAHARAGIRIRSGDGSARA